MSIYLFRSASSNRTFAYSTDVTGRNIPPMAEHGEWLFVEVVATEQLEADPETLKRLHADGFYIFKG